VPVARKRSFLSHKNYFQYKSGKMKIRVMTFVCYKFFFIFNDICCRLERRDSPQQWTDFLYNFVAVISLINYFTCTG
jgi:hypothetical protein